MAYSDEDLNSAVAAGAISKQAAAALRGHVSKIRDMPRGDEENFRLINSFNDIFVTIGVVILLVAVGAIGQAIASAIFGVGDYHNYFAPDFGPTEAELGVWQAKHNLANTMEMALAGFFVAATAWPLAEFFTRKRRMALPSIILLIAFVGGIFAALMGLSTGLMQESETSRIGALLISVSGLIAAAAAWLHWKRFMVPITVAAGAAGIAVTVIGLIAAAIGPQTFDNQSAVFLGLVFLAGLAIFAFAMRWDISDPQRQSRRSDVAFWLHLLAAPMIAHPIFALIGVTEGSGIGISGALAVICVYVLFGLVALAIDRRALLVSALAYVLIALTFLFEEFGAVELNFALTALVIGSALLTLSAFWSPIRAKVVEQLPKDMQLKLPVTIHAEQETGGTAPAA